MNEKLQVTNDPERPGFSFVSKSFGGAEQNYEKNCSRYICHKLSCANLWFFVCFMFFFFFIRFP